ncbi:MAG: TetR/AcrR family transcriptional regulator [Acidimicrobiales bacterium]
MPEVEDSEVSSLADEKHQLTEERIRQATLAAMALHGFSATVDEVAELAGISPRTVYRHFATHDQLIAAGIREGLKAAGRPAPGSPSVDDDLDAWLADIAFEAHTKNATTVGAAFWDVLGPAPSASREIEEARALRRPTRMQWMNHLSAIAWSAAGGEGQPPPSVVATFALALSVVTFHALAADFDYGVEETARFGAAMIKDRLAAAVEAQSQSSQPT